MLLNDRADFLKITTFVVWINYHKKRITHV